MALFFVTVSLDIITQGLQLMTKNVSAEKDLLQKFENVIFFSLKQL